MTRTLIALCCVCIGAGAAPAREPPSPYTGEQARTIKSLSADAIEGYLTGRGMGMAKVAELNHHPGPRHVLALAAQLELTKEQKTRTERVYNEMHEAAVRLGERIVAAEADLNRGFATGHIDGSSLERQVMQIGEWQGRLRFIHLKAHLQMTGILSREQISKYDALRGYHDPWSSDAASAQLVERSRR